MNRLIIFIFCIAMGGCKRPSPIAETVEQTDTLTQIRYATGFTVRYEKDVKWIEVPAPFQGATSGYKYILIQRGATIPPHDADVRVITIPLTSVVCTSTTHIPLLDYLNETDKLTGFPTTDYISSEKMRKRVDEGKITELGIDKGLNLERLAVLKPGMVMGYTTSNDFGQFKKVEELGVPVVINAEYLEKHPLGRAEWIKFMALFFNKEREADSVFSIIENNYNQTKSIARSAKDRPTVLSGIVYGSAWFMPGGKNYAATLLRDANCHYLWEDDPTNGFLELSFESVYQKAHDADLWIGVGSFATLGEINAADERYSKFKPFQQKQVYNYDARQGAKGGSEYMELGYLRPDIILNDLVLIAHPELSTSLQQKELYFHRKLPD
jgi:iron complex transport system substrate-binding protein